MSWWQLGIDALIFLLGGFLAEVVTTRLSALRLSSKAARDLRIAQRQIDDLHEKIAQAYQVIGHVTADDAETEVAEIERALDYFASPFAFDPDFLPWPRKTP